MAAYAAPLRDMRFVLEEVVGLSDIAALPGCEATTPDLVQAILEQAGRLAGEVIAPLNQPGDRQRCRLQNGAVLTPDGFRQAYARFVEGGWNGVPFDPEHGGQGLPWVVALALFEIWLAANMSFGLCPMLNQAAVALLSGHGSPAQKQLFLPNMIGGQWTGTMNLTEPQAGSDLAAINTRAVADDGHYRLTGQKIFITWGEHDVAENIIHMVLARTPDAPPGIKGISLFIVPKILVGPDGRLEGRNDVTCVSLEDKLGIHGSPTCTLSYGDDGGALGYLVGEPHQGLATMFVMMNEARFNVGVQGAALGERAYQAALAYARERVQGRDIVSGEAGLPILAHPDVKRMLVSMRARLMAMRGLLYSAAGWFDLARHHPEAEAADKYRRYVDLLMPVAKGWCTEVGNDLCDEVIQVFGGMGFVEETGVAQLFRDARVITIYEGTTGIQANDLLGRKILREDAATLRELIADIRQTAGRLDGHEHLGDLAQPLHDLATLLDESADWLLAHKADTAELYAGAVPLLHLLGIACGAWQMARLALAAEARRAAGDGDPDYLTGLSELARFYLATQAPQAHAHGHTLRHAGAVLSRFSEKGL